MELFCELLNVQCCIISFNVKASVAMCEYCSMCVCTSVAFLICDVYFH